MIIDREINQKSLKAHNLKEQPIVLTEIEDAAKKELPGVPTRAMDKMMYSLGK